MNKISYCKNRLRDTALSLRSKYRLGKSLHVSSIWTADGNISSQQKPPTESCVRGVSFRTFRPLSSAVAGPSLQHLGQNDDFGDILLRTKAAINETSKYQGPSAQELIARLRSLEDDNAPPATGQSGGAFKKQIESLVEELEHFFVVLPPGARAKHSNYAHLVGDVTEVVVSGSYLLRAVYSGHVDGKAALIGRIMRMLTASTALVTDRKGLKFSVSQIAHYFSNFKYINPSEFSDARKLLNTIAIRFNRTPVSPNRLEMTSNELGYAMMGFASTTSVNSDVKRLLSIVSRCISRMQCVVSGTDMSRALYGLKGLRMNCREMHDLLTALARVLRAEDPLSPVHPGTADAIVGSTLSSTPPRRQMATRELASAVYGLRGFSDKHNAVVSILDLLASQMEGILTSAQPAAFSGRELSMIFQGLKNMTFESISSRRLLDKLSLIIGIDPAPLGQLSSSADCIYELEGVCLANTINGFQNMSSDFPEVRSLIRAVLLRIPLNADSRQTSEQFAIRDVTAAYLGLRNMKSDVLEVKQLLRSLNSSMLTQEKYDTVMDSRCLGNVLYGLRFMHDDEPETRRILSWLIRHMKAGIAQGQTFVENRHIAYAFHGLRSMSYNSHEVKEMLDLLNGQLEHHLVTGCPPLQAWEVVLALNGLRYKTAAFDGEESLLQRTTIILAEALAQSETTERLNVSYICSIMASLNVLSSECSEVTVILQTLVKSMQESLEQGLSRNYKKDQIGRLKYDKTDEMRELYDNFPSHQLIADAIYGLHLLSKAETTVKLVDLFATFLHLHPSVYTPGQFATLPAPKNDRRYFENYVDECHGLQQNGFTREQVLQMMAGLQCMHGADNTAEDDAVMTQAVDRMFEYLVEQLFHSQDIDIKPLIKAQKHSPSVVQVFASNRTANNKELRFSTKHLGHLIMSIRDLDCSSGSEGRYGKISLLHLIIKELRLIVNNSPGSENFQRDLTSRNANTWHESADQIAPYAELRGLFQRCMLSFPYIENVPADIRAQIFETVATLNETLDDIQAFSSMNYYQTDIRGSPEELQWKQNWMHSAQLWFDKEYGHSANLNCSKNRHLTVEILDRQFLHHFDADIIIRIRMRSAGSDNSDGSCVERIINVEMEHMSDYLNTEKARFDMMRDEYLSKYHDVVVIRGSMHNIDISANGDISADAVFSAVKEAVSDSIMHADLKESK